MSLFPAAGIASATPQQKVKQEREETEGWLQNKSYHADKASELAKLQERRESSSYSSESDHELETQRAKKDRKRKKKHRSSPSSPKIQKIIKKEPEDDVLFGKVSFVVDQLDSSVLKFKSDKNPDMDNVHFGRPYKVLMPKFYRDLIYCVGTPKWKYIQLRETRKKKKRKKGRNNDKDKRYYNQKLPNTFEVLPNTSNFQVSTGQRFSENYLKISDDNSIDIRAEDDDVNAEDGAEDPMKKTTEQLNRRTRENPQDVETWIKLVSWQDEVMKMNIAHGRSIFVAEKKVEILNHAIKANPKEAKLQLMRLRLQSELMADTASLDKEWQNILFRFPDNIEVWKAYILHINCNNFTAFSLKRTRRAYGHCIEILRSIKNGTYRQEASSDISAENRLVQVFSEYAHFLVASGHTEQMVALYQCILELNFRGPTSRPSWSDLIDYIKLYFDSKEPRIGENGSRGFCFWASKHEAGGWVTENDVVQKQEEEEDDDADEIDSSESLTENWLKIDRLRCEKHWLPWRSSSEGDECDDEERKVSFSEIKDLMFTVDGNMPKIKLLSDFLCLLGSPISFSSTASEPFSSQHMFFFTNPHQPMRRFDMLFATKPLLTGKSQDSSLGALNDSKYKFVCEVFSQLMQSTNDESLKALISTTYMTFVEHRVISFYLDNRPKELRNCGKQAKKTAKQILSSNPDLYRVWCSLGVIEWLSGKRLEACKIFQTTLVMSSKSLQGLDRNAKSKLCSEIHFICRTFAQLHFATCSNCSISDASVSCPLKMALLSILTALGDGYKFSDYAAQNDSMPRPTSIMKALSGFARLAEELQSLYEQYEYEYEKDLANLQENEYLSSYFDVLCCHFIYSVTTQSLKDNLIINDAIIFLRKKIQDGSFQAKIDLEHFYILYLSYLKEISTTCRSLYRKIIYDASGVFPCNPFFAQLLGEVDMPSYLCGNARRHFTKVCSEHGDSVIPWLCATHFELSRRRKILQSSNETGLAESGSLLDTRIQNLFEHALVEGSNMGSVVLWRAYFASQVELNPSKALGVYTRAVDSCSWAVDLHLDILAVHPDKLPEVVDNMSKKGLRLRTPVEEIQLLMTI